MLVLVTGSRGWRKSAVIQNALTALAKREGVSELLVMHGGAPSGADLMCELVCKRRLGWQTIVVTADWDTLGPSAGHVRNGLMVDRQPKVCLAFFKGKTPGTTDCVEQAEAAGIEVIKFHD